MNPLAGYTGDAALGQTQGKTEIELPRNHSVLFVQFR